MNRKNQPIDELGSPVVSGKSRPWLVIEDPSGDFLGGQFQMSDLISSAENFTWPEGIRFLNIKTEEVKIYRGGVLLDE
jgi:hypothetical protein